MRDWNGKKEEEWLVAKWEWLCTGEEKNKEKKEECSEELHSDLARKYKELAGEISEWFYNSYRFFSFEFGFKHK